VKKWHLLTVFVCSLALYANTINHDYALDDKAIITQNSITQQGFGGIADHFKHSYWYGLNQKDQGNYRPISGASFSLEKGLFGNNPSAGHLLNILFYGMLCAVILIWLNQLALLSPWQNMLVVLLFASHPIHTEVVANIKSRDEIYCMFFFFLSLLMFYKWQNDRKWSHALLSGLLLLLSFLSKETSVALMPMFLIPATKSPVNLLKRLTIPASVTAIYLIIYLSVTDILGGTDYHLFDNALVQEASGFSLLLTKIGIIGMYIKLLFYPHPLRYDYSFNTIEIMSMDHALVWIGLIPLLLIGLVGFMYLRKRLDLVFLIGLMLFILPLMPVSNLFFLIGATAAERFLFMPSLGAVILFIYLWNTLLKKLEEGQSKKFITGLFTLIIVIFAGSTIARNEAWKNDETIFSTDIKYLKNSAKANHNLANIYSAKGDKVSDVATKRTYYETAIGLLENAIAIHPTMEFYKAVGVLYGNVQRWEGAIKAFTLYLEMNPGDLAIRSQLGTAYGISGNMQMALETFEQAYALAPNNADVALNLGKTYGMLGNIDKAIEVLGKAMQSHPNHAEIKKTYELSVNLAKQ